MVATAPSVTTNATNAPAAATSSAVTVTVEVDNNIILALLLPSQGQVQPGSTTSSSLFIPPGGPTSLNFPTPVNNLPSTFGTTSVFGALPLSGTNATGEIRGEVFRGADNFNASDRLAGVALVLEVQRGGVFVAVAATTADQNGHFSFTGLPSGNYRVRAVSADDASVIINGFNRASPVQPGPRISSVLPHADALESWAAAVHDQVFEDTDWMNSTNPRFTSLVRATEEMGDAFLTLPQSAERGGDDMTLAVLGGGLLALSGGGVCRRVKRRTRKKRQSHSAGAERLAAKRGQR